MADIYLEMEYEELRWLLFISFRDRGSTNQIKVFIVIAEAELMAFRIIYRVLVYICYFRMITVRPLESCYTFNTKIAQIIQLIDLSFLLSLLCLHVSKLIRIG